MNQIHIPFIPGTLIDDEDPAFMNLTKLYNEKKEADVDKEGDDSCDDTAVKDGDDIEEALDAQQPSQSHSIIDKSIVVSDDAERWIVAISEEDDRGGVIPAVAANISANTIRMELLEYDEERQRLVDFLHILQVLIHLTIPPSALH